MRQLATGMILILAIAAAARAGHALLGIPDMISALGLGILGAVALRGDWFQPAASFAGKRLLRIGVALLGAQITISQIASLGAVPIIMVASLVAFTIATAVPLARLLGFDWRFGLLTGGSVAICGASAALAVASVVPQTSNHEDRTIFTIVTVTTLSTAALIGYPPFFAILGFNPDWIAILIGATIHDVAQVVGAGYGVSDAVGLVATWIKLVRVALLPVAILILIAIVTRAERATNGPSNAQGTRLPTFVIAFVALMIINSTGALPQNFSALAADLARWLLVIAVAALGLKTSPRAMARMGLRAVALIALETLALLTAAIACALGITLLFG